MQILKRLFQFVLLAFIIASCGGKKDIPELLQADYKIHTIYFDEPKPDFILTQNQFKEILVLLHARVSAEEIRNHFKIDEPDWNERLNILYGEGLIKKLEDGRFVPTCFVLDAENAVNLKKFTDSLGTEMSGIAIDRLNKIKEVYSTIPSLRTIPFENISMFILGSVLHDKWQMINYHNRFIKAFAPHRGKARYYLSLIQNDNAMQPVIPMYETRLYDYPEFKLGTFAYCGSERSVSTFATSELVNNFGKEPTTGDSLFQVRLINELIQMNRNSNYKPAPEILSGLETTGLAINGKTVIPFITKTDLAKLETLATVIGADISRYFEERQTLFVKQYLNSQYKEETSYKEWMMWIYKFISAKTIDVLIQKSMIKEPIGRTASFILEK